MKKVFSILLSILLLCTLSVFIYQITLNLFINTNKIEKDINKNDIKEYINLSANMDNLYYDLKDMGFSDKKINDMINTLTSKEIINVLNNNKYDIGGILSDYNLNNKEIINYQNRFSKYNKYLNILKKLGSTKISIILIPLLVIEIILLIFINFTDIFKTTFITGIINIIISILFVSLYNLFSDNIVFYIVKILYMDYFKYILIISICITIISILILIILDKNKNKKSKIIKPRIKQEINYEKDFSI